jgi:hypothetical protein
MQSSLALDIEGLHLSKYLSEILTTQCGMTGIPDVPCDDIALYSISITQPDSRDFPAYPEKAAEAILRYKKEFKRVADTHWPANLLLVTHEYGVLAGLELGGNHRAHGGHLLQLCRAGPDRQQDTQLDHRTMSWGLQIRYYY